VATACSIIKFVFTMCCSTHIPYYFLLGQGTRETGPLVYILHLHLVFDDEVQFSSAPVASFCASLQTTDYLHSVILAIGVRVNTCFKTMSYVQAILHPSHLQSKTCQPQSVTRQNSITSHLLQTQQVLDTIPTINRTNTTLL